MISSSTVKDINLDNTDKILNLIVYNYNNILAPEDLLIIRYSGITNSEFYRMIYYQYLFNNNCNYTQDYFNYMKLIELMKNKNIDFYDYYLEREFIKQKMKEISFLPMLGNKNQNIESTLFVGSRAKEKVLDMKLFR